MCSEEAWRPFVTTLCHWEAGEWAEIYPGQKKRPLAARSHQSTLSCVRWLYHHVSGGDTGQPVEQMWWLVYERGTSGRLKAPCNPQDYESGDPTLSMWEGSIWYSPRETGRKLVWDMDLLVSVIGSISSRETWQDFRNSHLSIRWASFSIEGPHLAIAQILKLSFPPVRWQWFLKVKVHLLTWQMQQCTKIRLEQR